MQHQSAAPGPEVGWGIGLVGLLASALIGWFMDAGVGFLLFLLLFWGGVGTLFAFLVDRSTVEEHDRVEELQNTKLGTLAIPAPPVRAPKPVDPAVAAVTDAGPSTSVSSNAEAAGIASGPRVAAPTAEEDAAAKAERRRRERAERDRKVRAAISPSPRAYREQREAQERERFGDEPVAPPERPQRQRPPVVSASRGTERRPGSGRPAEPAPERRPSPQARHAAPDPVVRQPRSPREYREAKLEEQRRRDHHAAA
ncbi:hypothetical protein [Patulibacter minatonensis]|uniref:hypothetical protein n=1 Tax=Patulibacter minatonensis TaxID=298163 RepID=UPI00047BAA05|nr:hypothetical protein [Patulibacter minatonensis]